jgi:catechol 2,3-dioxygenase-like lactoylglutathione lyase family enzyme
MIMTMRMKPLLLSLALLAASCRTAAPPRSADPLQPYLVAVSVPQVDESVRWYREVLGFTLVSRKDYPDYGMTIAIAAGEGIRLELVQVRNSVAPSAVVPGYQNPASLHGFGKVAFYVADLRAWETRLRSRGAKFQLEPRENPADGSTSFIVLDHDGNWLQFTQPGRK